MLFILKQISYLAGDETELRAQLRQRDGRLFKFELPAGDSELDQRRQRRRKANRESARRVREKRAQQSGILEIQVIACVVTCDGAHISPGLTSQLPDLHLLLVVAAS